MNTSRKNTSKQLPEDISLIDRLLEFFTGKNNEDRLKEKQLKNIAHNLSQNSKFFNVRKMTIQPAFSSLIYAVFRNSQQIAKYFDLKNHRSSIKDFLIDSMLDKKAKDLKDELESDKIIDYVKTSQEPAKAIAMVQKRLKLFVSYFDNKKSEEINHTYNQICNLSSLICYEWYFFIRKFDSSISESNLTYSPSFSSLDGKYVNEDLIAINDELNGINLNDDFQNVFHYLEEVSHDKGICSCLKKIIDSLKKLKSNDNVTKMICLITNDPYFKPKSFSMNEKILSDYLKKVQDLTKQTLKEVVAILNRDKVNDLVSQIFDTTIISRMKNYSLKLSDFLVNKGVPSTLDYIDPLNYISAFLTDICLDEIKDRIDVLVIKGEWQTAETSREFVAVLNDINKMVKKVTDFDIRCGEEGTYGKELRRHSVVVKDASTKASVRRMVDEINNEALEIINETIVLCVEIGKAMKSLIEDYNLAVPVLIVNFKKIKWTFDDDFNTDMVMIYKKVVNMVNVLKRYTKMK
ncbi:MAG: hypothetical protein J1G30_03865 [Spirochaetales bacterium]|nr:hypothetical protein [Spirochaetales bacterium]